MNDDGSILSWKRNLDKRVAEMEDEMNKNIVHLEQGYNKSI